MACVALYSLALYHDSDIFCSSAPYSFCSSCSGLWIFALPVPFAILPGICKPHSFTFFRPLLNCLLPSEVFPNHFVLNAQPALSSSLCIFFIALNITCIACIFIDSHNKHELSSYHVVDTVLLAENTENKIDNNLSFLNLTSHWSDRQ